MKTYHILYEIQEYPLLSSGVNIEALNSGDAEQIFKETNDNKIIQIFLKCEEVLP